MRGALGAARAARAVGMALSPPLAPLPRLLQHGSTQVFSLMAWSHLPASERWQRVASIAYACGPWLIPTLAPVRPALRLGTAPPGAPSPAALRRSGP